MKTTNASLTARRDTLVAYLRSKVESEDWHGVADAAMDLRELDAKIELLEEQRRPDLHSSTVDAARASNAEKR